MRSVARRAALLLASVTVAAALSLQGQALAARPHVPVPPPSPRPKPPLPLAPAHGTLPGWLHTSGTSVVTANGRPIRLKAVNWYGAEGYDFIPGGLAYRPYLTILRTIKALGFNTIRLPFSNELVERNPIVTEHLKANPALRGKHALQIMDAIVNGARQVGLMVILDDHRSNAGWTAQENGLWYDLPRYTPQGWIADWVRLAHRYKNNPAVVGYDLRNEPHSIGPGEYIVPLGYMRQGAVWGPFGKPYLAQHDWRLAATAAGNAILSINPHALILVEGVAIYPHLLARPKASTIPASERYVWNGGQYVADVYWWGGNLVGAKQYPIRFKVPHQLVYSPHEYGPQMHGQAWIKPDMGEWDWQLAMFNHWGFLLDAKGPNAAPVMVGEFGTPTRSNSTIYNLRGNSQGRWFLSLVDYLAKHPNVSWAYWDINGTTSDAPGHRYGRSDGFSVLTPDWAHVKRPLLLKVLRPILK